VSLAYRLLRSKSWDGIKEEEEDARLSLEATKSEKSPLGLPVLEYTQQLDVHV
jgi:hypothetical protein